MKLCRIYFRTWCFVVLLCVLKGVWYCIDCCCHEVLWLYLMDGSLWPYTMYPKPVVTQWTHSCCDLYKPFKRPSQGFFQGRKLMRKQELLYSLTEKKWLMWTKFKYAVETCWSNEKLSCLVFNPYEYHMDLCNESCLTVWRASHPSVLRGKNFNVGHYTQTVQPNCFTPAMLIGTIDFFHSIPLSRTFTWPGFHNFRAKQNILASFSCTLFIWSGWNLIWWWSISSSTALDYFWVRFVLTRGITAVLLTA